MSLGLLFLEGDRGPKKLGKYASQKFQVFLIVNQPTVDNYYLSKAVVCCVLTVMC